VSWSDHVPTVDANASSEKLGYVLTTGNQEKQKSLIAKEAEGKHSVVKRKGRLDPGSRLVLGNHGDILKQTKLLEYRHVRGMRKGVRNVKGA